MSRRNHDTDKTHRSGPSKRLLAAGAATAMGLTGGVAACAGQTAEYQYPELGVIYRLDDGIGVAGCIELPSDLSGDPAVWTHPVLPQAGTAASDTAIVYPKRGLVLPGQPDITSADLAAARDARNGMSLYANSEPISVDGADVVCGMQVPGGAEVTIVGTDGRIQNLTMDAMHAGALAGMVAVVQVNPEDGSVARLDLQPTPGASDPTVGS